jgi:predicted protein tyrosine phosphatase
MPRIHVCPLSLVSETVAGSGADRLITLINAATPVVRPASIPPERHLLIAVNDIVEPMEGLTAPSLEHVSALLEFGQAWDRRQPLVVHCYAGISRSTAAAFILVCALAPQRREGEIARALRSASPFAYPNRLLVSIADTVLGRDGRMIAAIDEIGIGTMAEQSVPFHLSLAA